jgi:hypothetical protein
MLGQISTAEEKAGRGLLTAVVVTADEHVPGPGFFKLAKELAFAFDDPITFWADQLKRVYSAWSASQQGA